MPISGTNSSIAIAINSSTGMLATAGESEQFSIGLPATTPTQLAISPGDSSSCSQLLCLCRHGLTAEPNSFTLTPADANPFGSSGTIHPVNSAGGDNAVAVDPTNRLLYVGESDALSGTQTGGLRAFTIASSRITELAGAGSPYAIGGTGPSAILPSADGNYVFVANQAVSGSSTGNIASFSVSATALASIGSVAAGPTRPVGLAEDSTGSYLLAVDFAGNPDLDVYTMSSGTLTSSLTATTGTDPVGAIAIAAAAVEAAS